MTLNVVTSNNCVSVGHALITSLLLAKDKGDDVVCSSLAKREIFGFFFNGLIRCTLPAIGTLVALVEVMTVPNNNNKGSSVLHYQR